ncbi:MAG: acyl-CoA thioesterase [Polyangiaceae bacterium]
MSTTDESPAGAPDSSGEKAAMEMNQIVLPQHSNALGTVFGGTIMSWIDICAAMAAQRHSRSVVVTASMDQLDFLQPIKVGQLVNMRATINYVGRSSMEVGVRVESENMLSGERIHTASAYLTFVALDEHGRAKPVPPITPQTAAEKLRYREAEARREQRIELAKKRSLLALEASREQGGEEAGR